MQLSRNKTKIAADTFFQEPFIGNIKTIDVTE